MNEFQATYAAVTKAMEWMGEANCKGMDTNLFFAETPGSNYDPFAREVCGSCPVSDECFWYANETSADTGMFGGMSPSQRQEFRKKNKITLGMSKDAWKNRHRGYLRSPVDNWRQL
jgi:WhiB family redox-sensing transcriptional regulator